jgi:deoxycytidylate deaminase
MSIGINRFKNHPTWVSAEHIQDHCHVHAEIDALKKIKNARGATIYVARINKGGQPRFSRPCDRCYEAIVDAGIDKVIYTD